MTIEELEIIIKGINENEESAVKVLNKCTELLKENEKLKERLSNAATFVRENTYSMSTSENKTTKLELINEQWDQLIEYLEKSE